MQNPDQVMLDADLGGSYSSDSESTSSDDSLQPYCMPEEEVSAIAAPSYLLQSLSWLRLDKVEDVERLEVSLR